MSGTAGRLDDEVDSLDPGAVRALYELLGRDQEALAELVDAFVDEAPIRLGEIREGAEHRDAPLAGRAAHTLKSNGLTFGAVEFASLCRRLEIAAGEDGLAGSHDLIEQLERQWRHVREQLTTLRDRAVT